MKENIDENMMIGMTNYKFKDLPEWAKESFKKQNKDMIKSYNQKNNLI